MQKNIVVVGTGYVGLVTGTGLAELGQKVTCIDIDSQKIANLKQGILPIYEDGLAELVTKNFESGNLQFSTDLATAAKTAEIFFIAVGTPPASDGQADLSFVWQAAEDIGKNLDHFAVIATKSTVPVGTNAHNAEIIQKYYSGEFAVASNPEFLREGNAVYDFFHPSRIVLGTNSERGLKVMQELYEIFKCPQVLTNLPTAEMIKYASNSMLATKISFINEIANICERVGADAVMVARGMGLDERIGARFLEAGLGYGGSCFPKDVKALKYTASQLGYEPKILSAVVAVNAEQRQVIGQKIKKLLGEVPGKTVGVLGLAFKANSDDIRESAAIDIIQQLSQLGVKVKAYDPVAGANAKKLLANNLTVEIVASAAEAVESADLILIATEWPEFKNLDWQKIKDLVKQPKIVDGRNLLEPEVMKNLGWEYLGVGRD
ncbi:MAG: UDP-glucose/GDP-mannose dehydrogenase family protein [Candidatus Buchananbacteria bacterium]